MADVGNDWLVLCPYCYSQITAEATICAICRLDTTKDARIEVTRAQYDEWPRVACPRCGNEILQLADPCPFCGGSAV